MFSERHVVSAIQDKLILWTGEKHSGKTTSVARLVKIVRAEGFNVAGVLAPSVYHNGRLIGFDVLDLRNGSRAPLTRRRMDDAKMSPFVFTDKGMKLGHTALRQGSVKCADLVVVDEFGPLELRGQGWRSSVDSLLASITTTILLVVRHELVDPVHHIYADFYGWNINADEPNSLNKIIDILNNRRRLL
jgi:nucleoside-triphosphatase